MELCSRVDTLDPCIQPLRVLLCIACVASKKQFIIRKVSTGI